MKRNCYAMLVLLSLGIRLLRDSLALAAEPAPISGELPQRSGTIDILNLEQGLIVIDDAVVSHLRPGHDPWPYSGTKHSLRKGIAGPVLSTPRARIDPSLMNIWIGQ